MIFSKAQQLSGSNTSPNARPAVIFDDEFDAIPFERQEITAASKLRLPQTGDVEFNPLSLSFIISRQHSN
jgi:hypothetical protein